MVATLATVAAEAVAAADDAELAAAGAVAVAADAEAVGGTTVAARRAAAIAPIGDCAEGGVEEGVLEIAEVEEAGAAVVCAVGRCGDSGVALGTVMVPEPVIEPE
jgi:hypothetical protein